MGVGKTICMEIMAILVRIKCYPGNALAGSKELAEKPIS